MTGCTTPQTACEIHYAIGTAPQASGDQVVVLPGTYDAGPTPITASEAISIHGELGAAMPEIDGATAGGDALLVLDGGPGTKVSDLKLVQSASSGSPAGLADDAGGAHIDRVFVEAQSPATGDGVLLGNGSVLSDSVASSQQSAAVSLTNTQATNASARVENVTAWGGNFGIQSFSMASGTTTVTAENSIAYGSQYDLETAAANVHDGTPSISVGYSNFAKSAGQITDAGHNQSQPPALVNPAAGDFQELASSPTVDAGIASSFVGTRDLAGHSRDLGKAPDLGAYEFVVPKVTTGTAHTRGRAATLNGRVNPEGVPVSTCTFQYGTTKAYGSKAPCASAPGGGSAPVAVTAQLGSLQPGGTYHYRLVAADAQGTDAGVDRVFTVARPPAPLTAPHTTGSGVVGKLLTCSPGTWTGRPKLAFSWLRDGRPIRGARASTYRVTKRDVGQALQCRVSATNGVGTSTAVSNSVAGRARRR